nr:RNA-directed DNA polymerase, eukaryota, reverse transcriptase zinc-binding domain protein [Tanacetum cinerariifolium]
GRYSMSRIQSWNETIERMACRLSKWNLKTLSIGVWVIWKRALASKDKGGLSVSSLFALNRALMFKWVWRFITQGSLLWVGVIKALHGYDGKISQKVKFCYPSLWLDIIHEVEMFKSRGIDLMVNTRTDADLSASVQNALQTLLPQIRAEIREEFRTNFKKLFFLQFFPRAEQERLKKEYHSIRQTRHREARQAAEEW